MIEQGGRGGVADYTAQLAGALAAEGWQVALATAEDNLYTPMPGVVVHSIFHYVRGRTPAGQVVRRLGLGSVANGLAFLAALPRLVLLARRADLSHTQGWSILRWA